MKSGSASTPDAGTTAALKAEYERSGSRRSNLRYGYIAKTSASQSHMYAVPIETLSLWQ